MNSKKVYPKGAEVFYLNLAYKIIAVYTFNPKVTLYDLEELNPKNTSPANRMCIPHDDLIIKLDL